MSEPHVLVDVSDRVAVLTLNRPDVLNVFSTQMGHELDDAYRACDADDDVRVVVLTGAGRAFCAGADLQRRRRHVRGARAARVPIRPVRLPRVGGPQARDRSHQRARGRARTHPGTADRHPARGRGREVRHRAEPSWRAPRPPLALDAHPRRRPRAARQRFSSPGDCSAVSRSRSWASRAAALPAADVLPPRWRSRWDIAVNTAPVSVAASKRILWLDPPPSGAEIDRLEREVHLRLMGRPDARRGRTRVPGEGATPSGSSPSPTTTPTTCSTDSVWSIVGVRAPTIDQNGIGQRDPAPRRLPPGGSRTPADPGRAGATPW